MDPSSRWDRPLQVVNAVNALSRGGFQKEDPNYKPQSRVSQPSAPPPAHLYPQQHHVPHDSQNGQSASYFTGHPASPFQAPTPYLPTPEQGSPQQGSATNQVYSPPPQPSSSSQTYSQPRYDPTMNHGQGSPVLGGYVHQNPTYGSGMHNEPAVDYHSTTSTSSPHYQNPFDNGHQTTGGYNAYNSLQQERLPYDPGHPPTLQRSATQNPTTSYNYQYGNESGYGYESSPPTSFDLGPRSYTMPVVHDCQQSWDPILERCTTCKPIVSRMPS